MTETTGTRLVGGGAGHQDGRRPERWAWRRRLIAAAVSFAALGPAACRQAETTPEERASWSGIYSDSLPAVSDIGRVVTLWLGPDTTGYLAVEYIGRGVTSRTVRWVARGDVLIAQAVDGAGMPYELPLSWTREGDRLVPRRWDRDLYGREGLPLTRR